MKAMFLTSPKTPLKLIESPIPTPSQGQILVQVKTCAVCRTDLHIIDGDLPLHKSPLILGHQVVGIVETEGKRFKKGERIGIPWLANTYSTCKFCKSGRENLCSKAQ